MSNPIATRHDFRALSPDQQDKYAGLLLHLRENRLPCRCEMVGARDFTVLIAPGLPLAQHWIDRFDLED